MKSVGHSARRLLLKWAVASCLLAAVLVSVDREALWRELSQLPVGLLLPALVLSVFQLLLSAWRWCYTARLLGTSLSYRVAVREYYLASFLNQVLPGGMLGDVNRAWRHGRASGQPLFAIHGVAIERFSGQLVLGIAVLVSLAWLSHSGVVSLGRHWWAWGLAGVASFALCLSLLFICANGGVERYLLRLRADVVRTILGWPAFPIQMATSLVVLASYLGVFLMLAYGAGYLGSSNAWVVTAALCSLLLLSMVIPITVAGWGVRESAAAMLWPIAGLPPEQGVALSVGYGALVFLSTLPGLVLLVARSGSFRGRSGESVRKNPDQRAYHCPD